MNRDVSFSPGSPDHSISVGTPQPVSFTVAFSSAVFPAAKLRKRARIPMNGTIGQSGIVVFIGLETSIRCSMVKDAGTFQILGDLLIPVNLLIAGHKFTNSEDRGQFQVFTIIHPSCDTASAPHASPRPSST
ncbi:MAG: hypothetical protein WCD79_23370, partial [Chthoniobacteraceae bacterium]